MGSDIGFQVRYAGKERRRYFRIRYPLAEQPDLYVNGSIYRVTDLSEGGIKFHGNGIEQFEIDHEIEGEITFHDGASYRVLGKVIRIQNEEVVLQTPRGISFQRSIKEQQYLMRKYAGWPKVK